MQGVGGKVEPHDFQPSNEDIFAELARQSNTKITILIIAKNIDHSIVKPLTDQDKEEDYEVHLHINSFTLEDTPTKEANSLQVAIVPPTQQIIEPTQQQEEEEVQMDEETQFNNPLLEYAMKK